MRKRDCATARRADSLAGSGAKPRADGSGRAHAARVAQERLSALLADMVAAVPLPFFIKGIDLTFEFWSPQMQEISGVGLDELFGNAGYGVFPDAHMVLYHQRDTEVLSTNKLVAVDEPLMTRRGERWIHTQKVPVVGADGKATRLIGIVEDITDRLLIESERGRLFEELSRAIAERDRTRAAVAHDLDNSLALLSLTASSMHRAPPGNDSEWLDRHADRIARATQQMTAVVSDLRSEGLLRAGRLLLDLNDHEPRALVEEALELGRVLAESRGVELRIDVAEGLCPVACDGAQIARVLSNLLNNAIKFSRQGGLVIIRARAAALATRFEVVDDGPGIAAEDLPHVFEAYWQAAAARGRGTGLGLAIAKGIVEAHGGDIGAHANVGRGVTFFFTLPCGIP